MNNDKNILQDEKNPPAGNENSSNDSSLPVHNPLNPANDKKITEEDIENEQKYKEAMTERD